MALPPSNLDERCDWKTADSINKGEMEVDCNVNDEVNINQAIKNEISIYSTHTHTHNSDDLWLVICRHHLPTDGSSLNAISMGATIPVIPTHHITSHIADQIRKK